MTIKSIFRWVAAISILGLPMVGVVLILVAVFYPQQSHAVLWYWQDEMVYRYDTKPRETEEVKLPANGNVLSAKLSWDGKQIAFADEEGLKVMNIMDNAIKLLVLHQQPSEDISFEIMYLPYQWAPDGDWLLVISRPIWDAPPALYLYSLNNGFFQPVMKQTNSWLYCPTSVSWATDSEMFAVSQMSLSGGPCEGQGGVFVGSIRNPLVKGIYVGEGSEAVDGGAIDVAWRPNVNDIAFLWQDESSAAINIAMMESGEREVTNLAKRGTSRFDGLLWTSDGRILYSVQQQANTFSIVATEIDNLTMSTVYSSQINFASRCFHLITNGFLSLPSQ